MPPREVRVPYCYVQNRGNGTRRLVIIPRKDQIPRGTLITILKQAGLTKEEFLELLKS
ncbi:MAG: type II toxin-antitoxin system HicA family toxin [Archaeoglobales archaeon]|nr:MAG: type II toxin-antitoxin system HicA family toxin [Archaeoglobales archaeon]